MDAKTRDLLCTNLCGEWKRFARFCQIEESVISRIELDNKKSTEQSMAMLIELESMYEESLIINVINDTLSKLPRYDILRDIKRLTSPVCCPNIIDPSMKFLQDKVNALEITNEKLKMAACTKCSYMPKLIAEREDAIRRMSESYTEVSQLKIRLESRNAELTRLRFTFDQQKVELDGTNSKIAQYSTEINSMSEYIRLLNETQPTAPPPILQPTEQRPMTTNIQANLVLLKQILKAYSKRSNLSDMKSADLDNIIQFVIHDWKSFAGMLEFQSYIVTQIEIDNNTPYERVIAVLKKKIQNNPAYKVKTLKTIIKQMINMNNLEQLPPPYSAY